MSESAATNSLLIIGAGTLGARVGRAWLAAHGPVVAETRSESRHRELSAAGMVARTRAQPRPRAADNVLLSIAFSAETDYPAEAERALSLWNRRGKMVFTSSTAVYAEAAAGLCVEASPPGRGERVARMLAVEEVVRSAGGAVVRLTGLYDEGRGPHRVYLRKAESPRRPDGLVNLIHYDDAAELCRRVLAQGRAGAVYLGCDDQPITRAELVEAAVVWAMRGGDAAASGCRFTVETGPLGRRCDSSATRAELGWSPRHASFLEWAAG